MGKENTLAVRQASEAAARARIVSRAIRSIAGVEGQTIPMVSLRDADAVSAISFAQVEDYLIATRWKVVEQVGDRPVLVYSKGGREVLVGRREDFGDRPIRIAEIIEVVARVERRSELEVYWDVLPGFQATQGAGFVVLPNEGDDPSVVSVESPMVMFGADRLTFHVVASGRGLRAPRCWILTDNSFVMMLRGGEQGLSDVQRALIDAALQAVQPIFPSARLNGTELTMEVETADLGVGIVLFSQLCAQMALICQIGEKTG